MHRLCLPRDPIWLPDPVVWEPVRLVDALHPDEEDAGKVKEVFPGITFIGNAAAYAAGVRYVDCNANFCFVDDMCPLNLDAVEEWQAYDLDPIIMATGVVVDVHYTDARVGRRNYVDDLHNHHTIMLSRQALPIVRRSARYFGATKIIQAWEGSLPYRHHNAFSVEFPGGDFDNTRKKLREFIHAVLSDNLPPAGVFKEYKMEYSVTATEAQTLNLPTYLPDFAPLPMSLSEYRGRPEEVFYAFGWNENYDERLGVRGDTLTRVT